MHVSGRDRGIHVMVTVAPGSWIVPVGMGGRAEVSRVSATLYNHGYGLGMISGRGWQVKADGEVGTRMRLFTIAPGDLPPEIAQAMLDKFEEVLAERGQTADQ